MPLYLNPVWPLCLMKTVVSYYNWLSLLPPTPFILILPPSSSPFYILAALIMCWKPSSHLWILHKMMENVKKPVPTVKQKLELTEKFENV
jgi:hypothetical protein